MKGIHYAGLVLALTTLSLSMQAEDWSQWRGPSRTGISGETGLLRQWPDGGPQLLWSRTNLAMGYSTPSIVAHRLFLLNNQGLDTESVVALSTQDGTELWRTAIGKVGNPDQKPAYPAARSTPTVDGDRLYALGSDGDLVCLRTDNGTLLWHKNLRTEFGGIPGIWAYAESPLIDGNLLICTPGGTNATLVALQKETGTTVWTCATPGADPAGYASVVISHACGTKQYIQFLQKGLVGVDARTGAFLWRYEHTAKNSPANIPTPVVDGDYVYSATTRGGGAVIHLAKGASGWTVQEVAFSQDLPTSIGGAIAVDNYLYGTTAKGMVCADFKSGTVKWSAPAIGAASLCYADGLFFLHGEDGQLALVKASPAGCELLSHFSLPNQPPHGASKAWAYPVLADGKLYVRDFNVLWCYKVAP